jgi:hypothetical protein
MNTIAMSYKGYTALVHFCEDEGIYVGEVTGIEDIILPEGATIPEIQKDFEEMIDSYLSEYVGKGGKTMIIHHPDPNDYTPVRIVEKVREFLEDIGVTP